MELSAFVALAAACAPLVDPSTSRAIVAVESGFNPHAIGVVGGALRRQPGSDAEALATSRALSDGGWSFSAGLAQIHRSNWARLGLTPATAFEPCRNLAAMQAVLLECQARAAVRGGPAAPPQARLRRTLSCYYSGNFDTGFRHGYVRRVVRAAAAILPRPMGLATTPENPR